MSVLLLILKIIGIVLLVVLAVLVLLIIGVLFVPYAYRVKGSFHGKPDLTASIYGFGHLIGAGVILTETGAQMYLRICGIRKFLHSGNKEHKTGNTDQYEENVSADQDTDGFSQKDMPPDENNRIADGTVDDETQKLEIDSSYESESSPKLSKQKRFVQTIKSFGRKVSRIPENIKKWIAKIKGFFRTVKHAFGNIKQTIRKVKQLLTDESHKRAFTKVKAFVWQLLKILMPHRLKLNLEYSTGSPDTTAQLLGILAMFPIGYQNRWNVHPDFTADNAYADAEFDVRGRIFGFSLLKLILGLVLDKDCQKLYNHFKTMKA